ncbi:hypothetical protein RRG08_027525 [Elysia crispata]|uniref:Ubiquitin-like domain-containing protein n=1 Tax=Elysia crispata TaxID=231223 RepID=A0AAE1D384_9GAST|nr:hypothetical protein RRG08_027525 [Elysia crispata]
MSTQPTIQPAPLPVCHPGSPTPSLPSSHQNLQSACHPANSTPSLPSSHQNLQSACHPASPTPSLPFRQPSNLDPIFKIDGINCHHFKTPEESRSSISAEDSINVVVQCRHSRSKTTISAHKRQPLKYVIELYAEKMGLDAKSLRLVFDGEDVNPSDTPYKLDIEDLDIVDVIMKR